MLFLLNALAEPSPAGITPDNTPYNIKADYGFFHVYAFTMTLGVIFAIAASIIKLNKKKVPLDSLYLSIIFIIPLSLLGGSFFGKFGEKVDMEWYEWFYFWNPGMSIHGGVLFGAFAGIVYFYFVGKKNNISLLVYMDAILPNILIGQIIGRWGNFFNHELLGSETTYNSLSWLPAFIQDNCFKFVSGHPEMSGGEIVWRQPIFLYECLGNLAGWSLITFLVPNIGKLKKCRSYSKYNYSIKNNFKYMFDKEEKVKYITNKQVWDKAYFKHKPALKDQLVIENESLTRTQRAKKLNKLHNPNNEWIIRSGVEAGLYFFVWNFVREVLETQRTPDIYFVKYHETLDFTLLTLFVLGGLVLAVTSQFISPLYRSSGNKYEKDYYDMKDVDNWDLESKLSNNLVYGKDNQKDIEKILINEINKILPEIITKDAFKHISIDSKNKYSYKIKFKFGESFIKKIPDVSQNEILLILEISPDLSKLFGNIKIDLSDFNLFQTNSFKTRFKKFIKNYNLNKNQIHNIQNILRDNLQLFDYELATKNNKFNKNKYNKIILTKKKNIDREIFKNENIFLDKQIVLLAK